MRLLLDQNLSHRLLEVRMVPLKAIGYSAGNWWLDERGLLAFQNEVVKSLYYWLRY